MSSDQNMTTFIESEVTPINEALSPKAYHKTVQEDVNTYLSNESILDYESASLNSYFRRGQIKSDDSYD